MYADAPNGLDPYSDAYMAPAPAPMTAPAPPETREAPPPSPRGRSRSRSRSPAFRRPSPPAPRRPVTAPADVQPTNVLGVFGLSIRTQERDLDEEFGRFGVVDKVTIVYDQRSDRSRGFGFIKMATVEDATRCIKELNGIELNGRRIRVDYSVTDRPHAPTPGEYMGHRRAGGRREGGGRDSRDRDYRDRDREGGRDSYRRGDRDRDPYGRDSRDWRDRDDERESRRGGRGGGGYSPEYRRRRSYSRSPPRGGAGSSPSRARDYDDRDRDRGGDRGGERGGDRGGDRDREPRW